MQDKNILLMGVGNILLSDEGFGVRALDYLQKNFHFPPNVRLLDGATRGLLLLGDLMECDLAIILDIVTGGNSPGSMYLMRDDDLGKSLSFNHSMHQTSLEDVLISCDLAGHRPDTLIFGFEPFDYRTPRASLTEDAEKCLPEFCHKVVNYLRNLGINIVES